MIKVKEDMTGWKMWEHGVPDSKLIVIKQIEDHIYPNGTRMARYLCKCNCDSNKDVIATYQNIRNGHTKSCGCIKNKTKKKYNTYDLSGKYGIGWTTNTNKEFYFDLEDYDKIKHYCWSEDYYKGYSSVKTTINKKGVRMHCLLGYKNYDHINRNALDNRRENLRIATHQENMMNCSIRKDNSSGVIGVCLIIKTNKWSSQIQINNKHIRLGCFDNKEDAIKSRLEAEAKYFGEFAPQRHLFEEYGINT
jgi:hypothetical protein